MARGKTGSDVPPFIYGSKDFPFSLRASCFHHLRPLIQQVYVVMDTQRQGNSAKKPLSTGVKRPDAFWGMIVPSDCLEKPRPSPTIGFRSAYSAITHAEELKSTQLVAREEKAKQEPVVRAQPARSYISPTESLERVQSMQNNRRTDDITPSEDKVPVINSAPESVNSDEESSGESDSTEGSDGDGEYYEDSNETASDTSSASTSELQTSHRTSWSGGTSVRGYLGKSTKPSGRSAPKRNISFQPASTNDVRPRKRGRFVIDEFEEDIEEEEEEEEEEDDNDEVLSVPHYVNRSAKDCAQTQQPLTTVPPLSSYYGVWTHDQEETLYKLRNEGKDWKYIGERVLGRTASGARHRWDKLRSEALKSVGKRNKGRLRRQDNPLVSVMAKIPHKSKPWSKEEEELLVRLRTQGLTLRHASNYMQGRGYGACKGHWAKIKDRYPLATPMYKLARINGESVPSDCQDAYSSDTSQLEQEAGDDGFDSRSATLEGDYVGPSANGDSLVTVDKNSIPTKRLYAQAVLIYQNSVSAERSKRAKIKAPSTDDYDRQAAKPTTVDEAFTSGTKGLLIQNQPGMGSFNA